MRQMIVIVMSLFAGLAGGTLSQDVKQMRPVAALKPAAATKQSFGVLQCTELQVVDNLGRIIAVLGDGGSGGGLFLKSASSDLADTEISLLVQPEKQPRFLLRSGKEEGLIDIGFDFADDGVVAVSRSDGTGAGFIGVDLSGTGILQTTTSVGTTAFDSRNISSSDSGLLGDLDNDGDVDFSDFLTFASNFGRTS
jgi:hypothetical protein